MKQLLLGIVLACSGSSAHAVYYTYGEWDALGDGPRAVYLAGAFDSFIAFNDEKGGVHYSKCIKGVKFNSGQLAENVRAFARSNPEYQRFNAQYAMINYLIKLCGKAPE